MVASSMFHIRSSTLSGKEFHSSARKICLIASTVIFGGVGMSNVPLGKVSP